MKLRKITSLTALISFILMLLTSVILYIVPAGRVAYWSDWRLWGLSKTQWADLHINLGVLFLLAIFLHIYYNWIPILNYLKNRARQIVFFTKSFNSAVIITLIVILGTYFLIPPFSTLLDISEQIKDKAALKYGEPPFGHAELAPLKSLIKKTGLDRNASLDNLEKAGVHFDSPDDIVLDIAARNQTTPKHIFQIMVPEKKAGAPVNLPDTPPPGTGSKTLAQFCDQFRIDAASTAETLRLKGLKIDPDRKLKEIAADNRISPIELYDLIRDMQNG